MRSGLRSRLGRWSLPLGVMLTTVAAMAATFTVDDDAAADFSSIQAAINAANNADTILVEPGRYRETLNFLGKSITVQSTQGPEQTVVFLEGETRIVLLDGDSTLEGFTITGGRNRIGGGVLITGAAPTVAGNIIEGNVAPSEGQARPSFGGAIAIQNGAAPVITRNIIRGNEALGDGNGLYAYGGGIDVGDYTTATITSNVFDGNIAAETGGAVSIGFAGDPTPVVITNNTMWANRAESANAGAANFGGAIFVYDGAFATIQNNAMALNVATDGGGGLYVAANNDNNLDYDANNYDQNDPDDCAGITPSKCDGGQFFMPSRFQAAATGAFRLRSDSALVDLGLLGNEGLLDADGRPRVRDGIHDGTALPDIGAYENQREVTRLFFSDKETFSWDGNRNTAVVFDVYRDLVSTLAPGPLGQCWQTSLTGNSITDASIPPAGDGFFYLALGRDAVVGSLGFDSAGAERTAGTPCP